jgi:hypothetical protein
MGEFTREGFFYHSSFAEFLKAESPLLPDIAFNLQKGVRRLLAGCFKSLSALALDTPPNTKLCDLSLNYWLALWVRWNPDEDADPSSLVEALLAVDVTLHNSLCADFEPCSLLGCIIPVKTLSPLANHMQFVGPFLKRPCRIFELR